MLIWKEYKTRAKQHRRENQIVYFAVIEPRSSKNTPQLIDAGIASKIVGLLNCFCNRNSRKRVVFVLRQINQYLERKLILQQGQNTMHVCGF